jgi:hypothetical protein
MSTPTTPTPKYAQDHPNYPVDADVRFRAGFDFGYVTALAAIAAAQPITWAISRDGKTPYLLWDSGDGALLDLEVKRHGGTTCKMPLYAAPVAMHETAEPNQVTVLKAMPEEGLPIEPLSDEQVANLIKKLIGDLNRD